MPCMLLERVLHEYAAVAAISDSQSQIESVTIDMVSKYKWINYMTYRIRHECRWIDIRNIGTMTYTDHDIIWKLKLIQVH